MSELEEKLLLVLVRAKDELAVIAMSDDVIERAFDFKSRLAYTAANVQSEKGNCKFARLTQNLI